MTTARYRQGADPARAQDATVSKPFVIHRLPAMVEVLALGLFVQAARRARWREH